MLQTIKWYGTLQATTDLQIVYLKNNCDSQLFILLNVVKHAKYQHIYTECSNFLLVYITAIKKAFSKKLKILISHQ